MRYFLSKGKLPSRQGEAWFFQQLPANGKEARYWLDKAVEFGIVFFDEFRQNDDFIAFGGNANYNDIYVVEKHTGRVLVFSEEEEPRYAAAESFTAFLEAFILLIELEIALGRQEQIGDPLAILNEVVAAAGGDSYRAFYAFIFPIGVEEILN